MWSDRSREPLHFEFNTACANACPSFPFFLHYFASSRKESEAIHGNSRFKWPSSQCLPFLLLLKLVCSWLIQFFSVAGSKKFGITSQTHHAPFRLVSLTWPKQGASFRTHRFDRSIPQIPQIIALSRGGNKMAGVNWTDWNEIIIEPTCISCINLSSVIHFKLYNALVLTFHHIWPYLTILVVFSIQGEMEQCWSGYTKQQDN